MSWVENEVSRSNRNLLIFNGILGVAAGYALFALVDSMVSHWSVRGSDGLWVPMIPVVGILALAIWNCTKAIQRYQEIEKSPVWRNLVPYGQAQQLSSEIEQDLMMGSINYAGLKVTSQWLIRRSMFNTWVSPIGDIAWVYKKVTSHSTNGIPTGKTYAALILGRHKQQITISASQKKVDALMLDLRQRVPWALFGFNQEWQNAWKNNHAGFVASVDKQRQQFGKASGAHG